MRGTRSSRKTTTENRGNSNLNVALSDMHNSQRSVWTVNDDGHPKSPLSIERLQRHLKRRISKIARVKPMETEMTPEENGEPELFPFFIDRTPGEEMVHLRRRGRSFANDSVIVLDSPSVSTTVNNLTSDNPMPERRRKDSIDTVDLCSEEEEGIASLKGTKRRRRREETKGKRRKLCSEANDDHQPDIIVLDDDDESTSKSSNNNASIIIESVNIRGSNNAQHNVNSSAIMPVPFSDETPGTSIASNTNDRLTNFMSKYLDRTSAAKIPHDKDNTRMLSDKTNPGPSKTSCTESNATKPDLPDTVGSNVFIPHPMEKTGLRPIVIDGCNVAIGHGLNRTFSVRGLCICVEYFIRRGHNQVLVVVPLHQRSKVSLQDRDILEALRDDGHLVFTPSRFIDNQLISSYDDRYIVQYAAAVGGVIVSRDNFRDLLSENPTWRETITQRLLIPTWVGDMLMFPMDPLGRRGPSLDEFLSFPSK